MKKIVLAFTAIVLLTTACNKRNVINSDQASSEVSQTKTAITAIKDCNVALTDDMLIFESEKDINEYFKFLETHSTDEINNFETQNGFMSYTRKVENVLREYEALNEKPNVSMDDIHTFRKQNADYMTITDDDFFLKIEGLYNRLVNQDGYVQIANVVFKFEGLKIYSTDIKNIQQLRSSNYESNLISKAETKVINLKPTRQVNQWQNATDDKTQTCGNMRNTKIEVNFYATGPTTPAFGQNGNMFCTAGFSYYLKNRKRGWTGIWYGESRSSTNSGYYHSTYNNYTTYSDYDYSITVNRPYNAKTWSAVWNNDAVGAQLWANNIFYGGMWAYVTGTVTYELCGTKTWTY